MSGGGGRDLVLALDNGLPVGLRQSTSDYTDGCVSNGDDMTPKVRNPVASDCLSGIDAKFHDWIKILIDGGRSYGGTLGVGFRETDVSGLGKRSAGRSFVGLDRGGSGRPGCRSGGWHVSDAWRCLQRSGNASRTVGVPRAGAQRCGVDGMPVQVRSTDAGERHRGERFHDQGVMRMMGKAKADEWEQDPPGWQKAFVWLIGYGVGFGIGLVLSQAILAWVCG